MIKLKKKYGENSNEVKRYETKLLEARTAEQQLKNQIDVTNKSLKEQESVTRRAGQALDAAGNKMKSAGRTMTAAVTLPVAGLGTAIVRTGMDFEASMSEVKAISGATGKDFQDLGKKAEELGARTSKSASESAQA
ncbi:phage tail tape measure protein, partial [Bacillus cereus]